MASARKRTLRAILMVSGTVLLLLALLFPLRLFVAGKMAQARNRVLAELDSLSGYSIKYRSLAPSFLLGFEVRDLRIATKPEGREILSAARANAGYDFFSLLSGKGLAAFDSFTLTSVRASVRREDIEDLSRRFSGNGDATRGSPVALPERLRVGLRDFEFAYADSGADYRVKGSKADLVLGGDEVELRADLDLGLSGKVPAAFASFAPLKAKARIDGKTDTSFSDGRFSLALSATSPMMELKAQRFMLTKRGSRIEAFKVADLSPIDLGAWYELEDRSYGFSFRSQNFKPSTLVKVASRDALVRDLLSSSLSATARVEGNISRKETRYSLQGSLNPPRGSRAGNLACDFDFSGDQRLANVKRLVVRGDPGSVSASGTWDIVRGLPEGTAELRWNVSGIDISGEVIAWNDGHSFSLFSDRIDIGKEYLNSAELLVKPSADRYDLGFSAYLPPETRNENGPVGAAGGATVPDGSSEAITDLPATRLRLDGSVQLGLKPYLDLSLYLDRFPTSFAWSILSGAMPLPGGGVAEIAKDFRVSTEFYLGSDFNHVSFSAPEIILASATHPENVGVLSVSGTERSLSIPRFSVFSGKYDVDGFVNADFSDARRTLFELTCSLEDVPYRLSGELLDGKSLSVRGDYGFDLRAELGGPDTVFSLAFADLPLPPRSRSPRLALDLSGRYRNVSDWTLIVNKLRLTQEGAFLPGYAEIGCNALFDPHGGKLSDLYLFDAHSELRGGAEISWSLPGGRPDVALKLALDNGRKEKIACELSLLDSILSGTLSVAESPLGRIVALPVGGDISTQVRLSGTLADPRAVFDLNLPKGELLQSSLALSCAGTADMRGVSVRNLDSSWFFFRTKGLAADYSFSDSRVSLSGIVEAMIGQSPATMNASLSGKLLQGDAFIPDIRGRLDDLAIGPYKVASWPVTVKGGADGISVRAGEVDQLKAGFAASGDFSMQLARPLGMRARVDGSFRNDMLDAKVSNAEVEFPVFWKLFGHPVVDFTSGIIVLSGTIRGNILDPDIDAKGSGRGVTLSAPYFVPVPFGPFDIPLVMKSNRLEIRNHVVTSKAGEVKVSLDMGLESWLPSGVKLSIDTLPGKTLKARAKVMGFDIAGLAACSLALDIGMKSMDVKGSVSLEDGSFSFLSAGDKGFGLDPEPVGPQAANVYPAFANLSFSVGKRVEAILPGRDLPLVSAWLEPGSALAVNYDGDKNTYTVKGKAKLRGGEVFYYKRNFYLKQGEIAFNETQDAMDPFLTLRAERRDTDPETGKPILIILKTEKTRLSAFKVRFESIPARSDPVLVGILLGSPLGESGPGTQPAPSQDRNRYTALAAATVDAITDVTIVSPVERWIQQKTNLDLFSVRSPAVENFILGATNSPVSGAPLSFKDYFDNTTLIVGKYLGADMFLQGTLQFRKDSSETIGNLPLSAEFSLEWNLTENLRLQWNVAPGKLQDQLFVGGQTLDVTYSFRY